MLKKYAAIFFISMVPLIELRGAIPVSQSLSLPVIQSFMVCIIGNMIPVPFIYLFATRILEWGKDKPFIGKPFTFCLEKGRRAGQKLSEKPGRTFIALLLFVGIPVPGTGAWTGTLAAALLGLGFRKTTAAVLLGILLAGSLMMAASFGLFSFVK